MFSQIELYTCTSSLPPSAQHSHLFSKYICLPMNHASPSWKLALGDKKKKRKNTISKKQAEFNELNKTVLLKFICFFQIIRFLLYTVFFYPRLFEVHTCVPFVQVVYALRSCFLSDRFITLCGKLLKPFFAIFLILKWMWTKELWGSVQ